MVNYKKTVTGPPNPHRRSAPQAARGIIPWVFPHPNTIHFSCALTAGAENPPLDQTSLILIVDGGNEGMTRHRCPNFPTIGPLSPLRSSFCIEVGGAWV